MKQGKMSQPRLSGLKDGQDLKDNNKKILQSPNQANPDSDNMKRGWEIAEFEKCLEKVTYTNKIQRKDFKEDGIYPIVSQEKDFINGYWDNAEDLFKVDKPVVIFGDHTQVIKFIDFDFVSGADGVKILKPKDKIDSKYFYYFLQNIDLGSLGYARHYRLLKEIYVAYPKSLPEQQRIVSILDAAFLAIAKAKANAEQNLKNAKELFESYLQGVFEKKVDGWEEKKLGEVVEYDKNQNSHTGLPYVGLEHIESNSGRFIGSLETQEVKSSTFYFDQKHVLYGRLRPYLNKVLLPDFKGHCSTEIFPIKVGEQVAREFLFYWLIAGSTVKKIDATWTGARMPRANMNQVLEFDFAFPPLKEQQTIVRQLDALRAETQKLEAVYQKKIADLEELKKSILQKAFSGQLSESGLAGLKDEQDLNRIKKSSKSLNPVNPDSDNYPVNPEILKS